VGGRWRAARGGWPQSTTPGGARSRVAPIFFSLLCGRRWLSGAVGLRFVGGGPSAGASASCDGRARFFGNNHCQSMLHMCSRQVL
jgi:hypothetical protein